MTCQVIKTIKGNRYLYEQHSYRINGKVKTESRYIGALDAHGQLKNSPPTQTLEVQTAFKLGEVIKHATQPASTQQTKPKKPKTTPVSIKPQRLTLQINVDFQKHAIGELATQRNDKHFVDFLQNRCFDGQGIPAKHIPTLGIVKGVGVRAKHKKKHYIITLPRWEQAGTRSKYWHTFHQTQANRYLEAIQTHKPHLYEALEENFKTYYDKQNQAIAGYIMRSKRKEVFKWGLTLHFLYSKTVSAWTQRHLKPEKIGLSDYSDRHNWKQDTVNLMAEVFASNWTETYTKYRNELHRTEALQFKTYKAYRTAKRLDRLSGKRQALRKDCRKLNARRQAIYQTCNKLSLLACLFDGYPDPINPTLSDRHQDEWKATRIKWSLWKPKKR